MSLTGALWAIGGLALAVLAGTGVLIVRHTRRRNSQAKLESRLYRAVQEMKESNLMGTDARWRGLGT